MLVTKKPKLFKYLLDEMLLATHASMAEYHSVSTPMHLKYLIYPCFKRHLFKCFSTVRVSEALITSETVAETQGCLWWTIPLFCFLFHIKMAFTGDL